MIIFSELLLNYPTTTNEREPSWLWLYDSLIFSIYASVSLTNKVW